MINLVDSNAPFKLHLFFCQSVKLSRMQEEEENREILTELLNSDTSECVKNNSEQFLRLVNGWEPLSTTGN